MKSELLQLNAQHHPDLTINAFMRADFSIFNSNLNNNCTHRFFCNNKTSTSKRRFEFLANLSFVTCDLRHERRKGDNVARCVSPLW